METGCFDDLTRFVAGGEGTRRQALRRLGHVLVASVVGGFAARLVPPDEAAAKAKAKRKRKAKGQSQVQAEGKRKGKVRGKNKKRRKNPPPPPLPPPAQLCDASCEERGGTCCPNGGGCAPEGACCPGQKRCPDGFCFLADWCCAGEKRCPDGDCVAENACCPDAPTPLCDSCSDIICEAGTLVCRSRCQSSEAVCCRGECLSPCPNGCHLNATCDRCDQPPPGKEFCRGMNWCIEACPPDKIMNQITCQCECPATTVLLADGVTCCPRGRHCNSVHGVPTFCCPEGKLCDGSICCPEELKHESLCHNEICQCIPCREWPGPEIC